MLDIFKELRFVRAWNMCLSHKFCVSFLVKRYPGLYVEGF